MNDGLRQRLVGAIVLVCGVLILWPVIFSDAIGPTVDTQTQIPPGPDYGTFEIADPRPVADVTPAAEPSPVRDDPPPDVSRVDTASTDATPPTPIKAPAPAKAPVSNPKPIEEISTGAQTKEGLPVSWVLQIASFSQQANADAFKEKLQKKGYKAYTQRVKSNGVEATRVLVGPKISKEEITRQKAAIDKAFQVNALIVQYDS